MSLFKVVDSVLGTDFSGSKARKAIDRAAATAAQYNQQAIETMKQYGDKAVNVYKEYMDRGLSESEAMNAAAIEAQNEGFGNAQQIYQDMFNASQDARRPHDMAGLSMLQALPQLQAALGLPAYQLPTQLSQTRLGGQPGAGSPDEPPTSGQLREAGQTDGQLREYTGGYNVAASPLYQWLMDQMDDQLAHQLAAMGISGDPAAALIRSRGVQQLGAQERERQVANMMQMVQGGLGVTQGFGQMEAQAGRDLSGMQMQHAGNISNLYNQNAATRAGMFGNMANALGQFNMGMGGQIAQGQLATGQGQLQAGLQKAAIPNPVNQLINTGLQLYGMGAFKGG